MNADLKHVSSWLIINKLTLNVIKTVYMVVGSRQRLATLEGDINKLRVILVFFVRFRPFCHWIIKLLYIDLLLNPILVIAALSGMASMKHCQISSKDYKIGQPML